MSKIVTIIFLFFALIGGAFQSAFGTNVTLIDSLGQPTDLHIDSLEKFDDVVQLIEQYFKRNEESLIESEHFQPDFELNQINGDELALTLIVSNSDIVIKKKAKGRQYYDAVTKSEKKDIVYIINTLAWDSLIGIANAKSALKKAGERIDHIHPLKFLSTVFTDEELKAGIHAIRGRTSWIWDEFIGGIVGSLKEESANQNLRKEFIQDFSQQVNINLSLILPPIQEARWKDFVNVLIDNIARNNDANRYNM